MATVVTAIWRKLRLYKLLGLWRLIKLPPLTKEDERAAAILMGTSWISKNRPQLQEYLLGATCLAHKRGKRWYVSIAVNAPPGYRAYTFWVHLPNYTFTKERIQPISTPD